MGGMVAPLDVRQGRMPQVRAVPLGLACEALPVTPARVIHPDLRRQGDPHYPGQEDSDGHRPSALAIGHRRSPIRTLLVAIVHDTVHDCRWSRPACANAEPTELLTTPGRPRT